MNFFMSIFDTKTSCIVRTINSEFIIHWLQLVKTKQGEEEIHEFQQKLEEQKEKEKES